MQINLSESYIRATFDLYAITAGLSSQQWLGTQHLAALGCSLEGGLLYMSRVLVTVGVPHVVSGQS